jgi:hypothetical protein
MTLYRKHVAKRRRVLIKEAIMKIESMNPLHEWSPRTLFDEMRNTEKIPYRRLLSHLKKLTKDGYLRKMSRGHYLSKNSLFWKKTISKFLVHDIIETTPHLEGRAFEDLLARNTRLSTRAVKELTGSNVFQSTFKRIRERLSGQGNQLENARNWKHIIAQDVEPRMRRDLQFVEDATEITILSSKADLHINISKLREVTAEILYYLILHERYSRIPHEDWIGVLGNLEKGMTLDSKVKRIQNPQTIMRDNGLSIMIEFDPGTSKQT